MFPLDTNKIFEVSNDDREKEKKSMTYKIINTLKDNWQLIGSIILIIMIWYYFNYLDSYKIQQSNRNIQSGGAISSYRNSVKARAGSSWSKEAKSKMSSAGSRAGQAISAAPGRAAAYAQKQVNTFKVMSGAIYQIIFQIALFIMMFLIFGPALALFGIMILCFAVLKQKVLYVKEL